MHIDVTLILSSVGSDEMADPDFYFVFKGLRGETAKRFLKRIEKCDGYAKRGKEMGRPRTKRRVRVHWFQDIANETSEEARKRISGILKRLVPKATVRHRTMEIVQWGFADELDVGEELFVDSVSTDEERQYIPVVERARILGVR